MRFYLGALGCSVLAGSVAGDSVPAGFAADPSVLAGLVTARLVLVGVSVSAFLQPLSTNAPASKTTTASTAITTRPALLLIASPFEKMFSIRSADSSIAIKFNLDSPAFPEKSGSQGPDRSAVVRFFAARLYAYKGLCK
jgi:hypothetical protein